MNPGRAWTNHAREHEARIEGLQQANRASQVIQRHREPPLSARESAGLQRSQVGNHRVGDHAFDFPYMLEQRKRFRVENWLDETLPHKVVKRRIKAPKVYPSRKQQVLRRIKIEIVTLRFGKYMGQTQETYERYSTIAERYRLAVHTVSTICLSYARRDPPHVPERHRGGRVTQLTREMADYIGSRECLMEWVALPLRVRAKLFNRKFGTCICG